MKWNQTRALKLFWLLGLPVVCFGQTAGGGSSTASNPLNAYAAPCISQVKQYITVNCQITPTGVRNRTAMRLLGASQLGCLCPPAWAVA